MKTVPEDDDDDVDDDVDDEEEGGEEEENEKDTLDKKSTNPNLKGGELRKTMCSLSSHVNSRCFFSR